MGTGPTTALSRGPSTTLPSGHPPRRISPVPRATLRAKQWSGSQSPATTRRTPSSAFDGRSLHPGTRRGGDRPLLAPPNNTYIQPIGHLDGDVAHDTQSPVERNLTREPMVGVAIRVGLGRGRQSTDRNDSSERGPPSLRKHFRPRWRALSASGLVDEQHNGRPSLGRSLAIYLGKTPCSPCLTAALQDPDRGRFLPGHPVAEQRRKHLFPSPK